MKNNHSLFKPISFLRLRILCFAILLFPFIGKSQSATCLLDILSPAFACVNASVTFVNNTSSTGNPVDCFPCYVWYFPGGNPSSFTGTTNPPPVTYSAPGTYTVTLYSAGASCFINPDSSNFVATTITIQDILQPSFTILQNPVCVGETATFENTTIGDNNTIGLGISFVSWDFGDGNTSLQPGFAPPQATHIYTAPGIYTVTLCASNSCGQACASQTITVNSATANFTYVSNCRVHFTSDQTCMGEILSHSWNFGDTASGPNNISTAANPIHTFTLTGHTYIVSHTITTANGIFTVTQTVIQVGGPVATIVGAQTNNCGNGFISYYAPCVAGIQYTWNVIGGTGTPLSGCQCDVNWLNAGGTITLTATDTINDCSTTTSLEIPICCEYSNFFRIDNASSSTVLADPVFAPYITGNTIDGTLIPDHIVINGIFTIDVPITFLNCGFIDFGANAQVQVLAGQTLTFDNSETTVKCEAMWDGIYINGPTAHLRVINNSLLSQAKNAIVSVNGGDYFVDNSRLEDDYKGIVVKAYNGTHPGIVTRSNFAMTSSFLTAFPPLPFSHTKTVCGIEIEGNADITIGDGSSSTLINNFNNILVGVRSKDSRTKILNCRFINFVPTIPQQLNVPNSGTGVVAIGGKNSYYQPSITVGGTGFNRCLFQNMRIGVDASEQITVDVQHNNIREIRLYGVRVQRSGLRTIKVENNRISNQTVTFAFGTGVLILECYSSSVFVNNNVISQTSNGASNFGFQSGTGIRVACVSPGDVAVTINANNSITRVRTGIWLQNLVGKNKVFVTRNVINFQKPNVGYTSAHYGILLEHCATVRVRYNNVVKVGAFPTAAMQQNLRGIFLNNSTGNLVSHNTITKMGSGIFGWELCGGSTLACNTLDHCYDGFFFTGGLNTGGSCDIGVQVGDPIFTNTYHPTGNTWIPLTTPGQADIAGFIQPTIDWYTDVNYSPTLNLQTGSLVGNATTLSTEISACDVVQFLAPAPIVDRFQNVGQAVLAPVNYSNGSQQSYLVRRDAHIQLRQSPIWLNLNSPQDSLFQGFYSVTDQTNIGLFRNFEEMASVDSVVQASNILSNVIDTNLTETNLKTVYSIYTNTWMQGQYFFSPADSSVLYNIAVQHASDAGDAVFSARVLLGLQVDEFGGASSSRMTEDLAAAAAESVTSILNIFPNPTDSKIVAKFDLEKSSLSSIKLLDATGRLIYASELSASDFIEIDCSALSQGFYFIQILIDGVVIETKKMQVIHN